MTLTSAKKILYTIPSESLSQYGLLTLEVFIPSFAWAEMLTHKRLVRSAASNRALSVSKNIEQLGYYTPPTFYFQGKGMQSGEAIDSESELDEQCFEIWEEVWNTCVMAAQKLESLNVAKEQASRVLPTFKMMHGIVTGTIDAWNCFLELRDNPKADKAMQEFAKHVKEVVESNDWVISKWHVPFLGKDEEVNEKNLVIASARIARVSYNSMGSEHDKDEDYKLGVRLLKDKHLSPVEHIAVWSNDPNISAICSKEDDKEYTGPMATCGCLEGTDYNGWTNLRSCYERDQVHGDSVFWK